MSTGLHVFTTALGECGIGWSPAGLLGIQLPETTSRETAARLRNRFPALAWADPPSSAERAIEGVRHVLAGEKDDLDDVLLDLSAVGAFEAEVYRLTRAIPPGSTTTYGDIARPLGGVHLARAVGQALGRNPWPIVIPCHRVTGASGRLGGFSATGGVAIKRRLLEIERAFAPETLPLFQADSE